MISRRALIFTVIFVAIAGAAFGLLQMNRSRFGIPGFYVWKSIGGAYRGGQRADVNGISLYYETYGAGPPVIVLHGAGAFLETMHYFIRPLCATYTVIAVDSRAQGRSTDGPGSITYDRMGDDVLALMDELNLAQADVVGWSDGGIVGLAMAMKQPDRIRRLVAIGANYDTNGLDLQQFPPGRFRQVASQVKPFYEAVAPDPEHFPVMVDKIDTMVSTEPHYTLADLGRIRAKTLIVAGERDIVLRAHTDAMARAIPGARETIIPDTTHAGPLETPDPFVKATRDFLGEP
jgi:pimeloyl-ACP methyl ester carboxylesterase